MAPMKGMIFGWFNPFHTIACLQSLYAPTHVLQYARRDVPTQNTNFLNCIARLLGDPWVFDTYSDATVCCPSIRRQNHWRQQGHYRLERDRRNVMVYEGGRIVLWLRMACKLYRHRQDVSSVTEVTLMTCGIRFVSR